MLLTVIAVSLAIIAVACLVGLFVLWCWISAAPSPPSYNEMLDREYEMLDRVAKRLEQPVAECLRQMQRG